MVINETKLFKEELQSNKELYRILAKDKKILVKLDTLEFGSLKENTNFRFCLLFSISYLMNHNLTNKITPRTIKKLFSYIVSVLEGIYKNSDLKQKEAFNKLNDNKFLSLPNKEDIDKENFDISKSVKFNKSESLENQYRALKTNYYYFENDKHETNLFIIAFEDIKRLKIDATKERYINRLLDDIINLIDDFKKDSIDLWKEEKTQVTTKEDQNEITIFRAENIDNIFNFNYVAVSEENIKNKNLISNYKKGVDEQIIKYGEKVKEHADYKELEELKNSIEQASKNIIDNFGNYYLIESKYFNTVVNVDVRGIYFITNNEGEKIARLPTSLIFNKDPIFLLDKIFYKAIEDINNPKYELKLSNEDIAELTDTLDYYEAVCEGVNSPKYHTAFNVFNDAKKDLINKITEQLSYIRLELKGYKGNILTFKELGENFKDGIKIIFSREYMYIRLSSAVEQELKFNSYVFKAFNSNNTSPKKIYENIVLKIFKETVLNTESEYNYIFTLKELRFYSGYTSTEFIKDNLDKEQAKKENKKIQDKLKNDLKALKEKGFIFISKLKDKKEFTIMLNNKKPFLESYNQFKAQCEKNGHEIE